MPLASSALALDIVKSPFAARSQRVCVRVGDRGAYSLSVALLKDGSPLPMSGLSATLKAVLADGTYAEAACAVDDAAAGLVSCTLGDAFASVPGSAREAYVEVAQGASVVGSTGSFDLLVERGADLSAAQAAPYVSVLDELAERAEGLADDLAASIAASDSATASANSAATSATAARDAALVAASRADVAADAAAEAMQGITAATVLRAGNYLAGEVEGQLAHVEDAWPSPVGELRVLGRSEQASTRGVQLYDEKAYPLKAGEWISGTGGGVSLSDEFKSTSFVPVGDLAAKEITLNRRPGGRNPGFAFYGADFSFISGVQNNGETAGTPMTVQVPASAAYMRFTVPASATDVQIELGSTATAWEPYTGGKPSPSPDYPQAIESAECGEVVAAGRNLFDIDVLLQAPGWTKQADGVYVGQGTGLHSAFGKGVSGLPHFAECARYVFACHARNAAEAGSNGSLFVQFVYTDGTENSAALRSSDFTDVILTSLSGKTVKSLIISFAYNCVIEVQSATLCRLDDWHGEHLAYTGSTCPLAMPDGSPVTLRSLPDGTRDEVRWGEDGGRELVRRVGHSVFDGSADEAWSRQQWQSLQLYKFGLSGACPGALDSLATTTSLCNAYKYAKDVSSASADHTYHVYGSGYIDIRDDSITSVESWREHLAASPVVVDYLLSSPEVIPLTSSAAPRLPESTSNVWATSESGVQPDVALTYQVDVNIAHKKLEQQIAALSATITEA